MKIFATLFLLFISVTSQAQSFTVIDSVPEGAYGTAAWGDYNNDGFKDLVYISQTLPMASCQVFSYNGSTFDAINQYFPLMFNPGACWGDLNNDGFDDLVITGYDSVFNSSMFIFQSLGNGSFVQIMDSFPGASSGSVDIADYNNDGLADIALTGFGNSTGAVAYILRNDGNFHFTNINAQIAGIHFGELQWGDYNNDGLKDLAITGIGDFNFHTHLYKNMGQDSFLLQNMYMKGLAGTLDWCDFDGDGWLDLYITGYDSTSVNNAGELHHNNQDGTFTIIPNALPVFGEPAATDIADFNNDGLPDVCFMGGTANFFTNYSAICYNLGNNQFQWNSFLPGVIINCIVSAADFDNDGDADLFFGEHFIRNDGVTNIESFSKENISIYPNPASDKIYLKTNDNINSAELFDMTGAFVQTLPIQNNNIIDLNAFNDGIYMINLKNKEGVFTKRKIIIQK